MVALLLGLLLEPFSSSDSTKLAQRPGYYDRGQQQISQQLFCEQVQIETAPRFMAYDVVNNAEANKFGPEAAGDSPVTVIAELARRVCIDPALLVDLEYYHQFGYEVVIHPEERRALIEQLWHSSWATWSNRAEALITVLTNGGAVLLETSDPLESWYYIRGNTPDDIPDLHRADLNAPRSVLVSYLDKAGNRRALSLKCGFQPTRFKARPPRP